MRATLIWVCGVLASPVVARAGATESVASMNESIEASATVSHACEPGRVSVGGHCCWLGQGWDATTGRCVGMVTACPPGTVADPVRGTDCLRVCRDGGLELAPGHCCPSGDVWDESSRRCAATVLQCLRGMVATRSRTCRAADAACTTDQECNADSVCRNGSCERHTSRWRIEALADIAVGYSGHWNGSTEEWFSSDIGWGFSARFLKGMSQRWDWGTYLGYMAILGINDQTDPMDATTHYAIINRLFRGGGLVRIAAVTGPKLRMGLSWEMGFIAFRGGAPGGLEGALDLFVEIPMTAGRHRWVATAALGCRGSVAYRNESPNGYGIAHQTETWMATPTLRIGVGLGR